MKKGFLTLKRLTERKRKGWIATLWLGLILILLVALGVWSPPSQVVNNGSTPATVSEPKNSVPNVSESTDVQPKQPEPGRIHTTEGMEVHFLDVGQGDSVFIDIPEGPKLLIDGGDREQGATVVKHLQELGIERLDYLIATHPHADHIGGLPEVIENFDIGQVFMPKVSHTTVSFEKLLRAIKEKGLKIQSAKAGVTLAQGEYGHIAFLGPLRDYGEELNNWSAILKVTYFGQELLLMGDAEREVESELLVRYPDLSADILKVGHHGSYTSSINEFLDQVKPGYAIVSSGAGNSYGHPHEATLKKLRKRGIQILRTDLEGTIVFNVTKDGINLKN